MQGTPAWGATRGGTRRGLSATQVFGSLNGQLVDLLSFFRSYVPRRAPGTVAMRTARCVH